MIEEQIDILRRITERGLRVAQEENSKYIDVFQHLLDEIERLKYYIPTDGQNQAYEA